jgi:hypothetical protein
MKIKIANWKIQTVREIHQNQRATDHTKQKNLIVENLEMSDIKNRMISFKEIRIKTE